MTNSVERVSKGSRVQIRPRTSLHQPLNQTKEEPTSPTVETIPLKEKPPKGRTPRQAKGFSPWLQGLVWGLTFGLTVAASATVGATLALVSPLAPNITAAIQKGELPWAKVLGSSEDKSWHSLLQYRLSRPVNILVLGVDRVSEDPARTGEAFGGHSDTILLLRFDPQDHSLSMLSIPRDSRVEIPGVGFTKINEANVRGGPALTARVASKTLNNVPIDRYLRVTTDAFKELVDLVGGVEVFVPRPMSYQDLSQNLEIDLVAGWQTLNGEQAEQFARFRSDRYGDIGRVQRQQILLKALQKRLNSPAILPRLPQGMKILQQHIDTNLTWEEMLALANFGRQLERDQIKMVMLPGRFSQPEEYEMSFWIVSEGGKQRVMQKYFDTEPEVELLQHRPSSRVRIALENATDDPAMANRAAEYLAEKGYENVYLLPDSPQLLRETEIVVQQGDLVGADTLQNIIGVGRVEASSTGDLDSDLTIRLGLDAKKQLSLEKGFLKGSE